MRNLSTFSQFFFPFSGAVVFCFFYRSVRSFFPLLVINNWMTTVIASICFCYCLCLGRSTPWILSSSCFSVWSSWSWCLMPRAGGDDDDAGAVTQSIHPAATSCAGYIAAWGVLRIDVTTAVGRDVTGFVGMESAMHPKISLKSHTKILDQVENERISVKFRWFWKDLGHEK